jgi:hypothetical protein
MRRNKNQAATAAPRDLSEVLWMVPFFAVICGGIGFFFLQIAQYGLH